MAFLPVKQYAYEEREKYEEGGVYCFYPFDNKLKKENGEHFGVFKVGISTYIHNRLYSYHTALPAGFHLIAYLRKPTKKERNQPTSNTTKRLRTTYINLLGDHYL